MPKIGGIITDMQAVIKRHMYLKIDLSSLVYNKTGQTYMKDCRRKAKNLVAE